MTLRNPSMAILQLMLHDMGQVFSMPQRMIGPPFGGFTTI